MARVFVLCQPTRKQRQGTMPDLRPLYEWGDVVYLFGADELHRLNSSPNTDSWKELDRRLAMEQYDVEEDYVAWIGGDTLTAVLFGAVLAWNGAEEILWLRFDRDRDPKTGDRLETGRYRPVRVRLQELTDDGEETPYDDDR